MKVRIYGMSDDLIEVESVGDVVSLDDEFNAWKGGVVELSTGDVFSMTFDGGGVWRAKQVAGAGGDARLKIIRANASFESDMVEVEGEIEWVEFWSCWPPSTSDVLEKIANIVEDGDVKHGRALRALHALKGRQDG